MRTTQMWWYGDQPVELVYETRETPFGLMTVLIYQPGIDITKLWRPRPLEPETHRPWQEAA